MKALQTFLILISFGLTQFIFGQQTQVTVDDRGHLGVGTANPTYRLQVTNGDSSLLGQGINIYNDYDLNAGKYGLYNYVTSKGLGPKYGQYNFVVANSDITAPNYGVYSRVNPSFGAGVVYGIYSKVDNNGSGPHYGLFVDSRGEDNWASYMLGNSYVENRLLIGANNLNYGILAVKNTSDENTAVSFDQSYNGASQKNSLFLTNSSAGSGNQFGVLNYVYANSQVDKNAYGLYSNISSGATGKNLYGVYVTFGGIFSPALGKKHGVYINAPGADHWAGYFLGRSYFSEAMNIGTTIGATGYLLSVNGKIMAEEMRIEDSGGWADYVFEDSYQLKSLENLSEEIKYLGHLPGIPSAREIENNGLLVGDMQKRQMEKIEELTLYILQLHERISELEKTCKK